MVKERGLTSWATGVWSEKDLRRVEDAGGRSMELSVNALVDPVGGSMERLRRNAQW